MSGRGVWLGIPLLLCGIGLQILDDGISLPGIRNGQIHLRAFDQLLRSLKPLIKRPGIPGDIRSAQSGRVFVTGDRPGTAPEDPAVRRTDLRRSDAVAASAFGLIKAGTVIRRRGPGWLGQPGRMRLNDGDRDRRCQQNTNRYPSHVAYLSMISRCIGASAAINLFCAANGTFCALSDRCSSSTSA